jgi:predicted phage terminase large subunit-like protein
VVKTEWLKSYEPGEQPANFFRIVQSWDTANKANELADYSVCTTWGVKDKCFYLLDVFRRRLNYPDVKRSVKELALRYNSNVILIEDKASGTQLIQDLKDEGMFGVTAYEPPVGTDKIMRLHAQTAIFENGHVFLPQQAPWLADYVAELTGFPGSKYDDQVDSTTQALANAFLLRCGHDWACRAKSCADT